MAKTKDKAPEERIYFFNEEGEQVDGFLFLPARGVSEPLSEDLYELMKATLTELITGNPKAETYHLMMEALIDGRYGITPDEDGAEAYWYYGDDKGEEEEEVEAEAEEAAVAIEEQEPQTEQTAIDKKMAIEAELDTTVQELSSIEGTILNLNEQIRELEEKAEDTKDKIASLTEQLQSLEDDFNREKAAAEAELREALEKVEKLKKKLGLA